MTGLNAVSNKGGTIAGDLGINKSLNFGASTRQMLNLWNTEYGIGIQARTQYYRTDGNFAWYKGGSHNDAELNPGTNGTAQMVLKDGNLGIGTKDPKSALDVAGYIVMQKPVADTASALLTSLPNSSLIIGGPTRDSIVFYWKDESGKRFQLSLPGKPL